MHIHSQEGLGEALEGLLAGEPYSAPSGAYRSSSLALIRSGVGVCGPSECAVLRVAQTLRRWVSAVRPKAYGV